MSTVIIQLQGGLVQDVFIRGTGKPTKYITVDEDCDGADPDDLTTVQAGDSNINKDYEAVCGGPYKLGPLVKGCDVAKMVKAYLNK